MPINTKHAGKPGRDTRERVLDAAERLFALRGFQQTSIKRLAREAGVNQAAVNYYFGSKAALIEKVIERRLQPINQQRLEKLEAVRQAATRQGRKPFAEDVLRAFIEPAFTLTDTMERKKFLAIASRAFYEPDANIRTIFINQFKPPFTLLSQAMRESLPDMPEDVLSRRIHFTIGAMTHCMRLCSDSLSLPDLFPPMDDPKAITNLLLDFVTSGMCGPYSRKEG
jgi:AcrR family transcriptional regulator